jgi:peptide deformylase
VEYAEYDHIMRRLMVILDEQRAMNTRLDGYLARQEAINTRLETLVARVLRHEADAHEGRT